MAEPCRSAAMAGPGPTRRTERSAPVMERSTSPGPSTISATFRSPMADMCWQRVRRTKAAGSIIAAEALIGSGGSGGSGGSSGGTSGNGDWINETGATVEVTNGGSATLEGFDNQGAITATVATLTLDGPFTNEGTISTTDSTVNLGGSLTLEDFGDFTNTDPVALNLTGTLTLDNVDPSISLASVGVGDTLDATSGDFRQSDARWRHDPGRHGDRQLCDGGRRRARPQWDGNDPRRPGDQWRPTGHWQQRSHRRRDARQ